MLKRKTTNFSKYLILICILISIVFLTANLYAQTTSCTLVGHWTFDSDYSDSTPDPAVGVPNGGTTYITNEAMVGEGSLYVAPENNAGLNVDKPGPPVGIPDKLKVTNKFTLSAWAKFEEYQPGSGTRFAFILNHINRDYGYGMYVQIKSGATLYMVGLSSEAIKYQPPDSIPKGTWVFITYTYDNTRGGEALIGYKNGEYDPIYVNPTSKDHVISNTKPLYIGRGGEVGYAWGGLIDELSIWNGTLSHNDVKALYNLNINSLYPQDANFFSRIKTIHDRGPGSSTNFGKNSCSFISGLPGNVGDFEEIGQPGSGIYSLVMSDAGTGIVMTTNSPQNVDGLRAEVPVAIDDIVVSWNDNIVETSYTLYWGTNDNVFANYNDKYFINANTTNWTCTNHALHKPNYYWIKANNAVGSSAIVGPVSAMLMSPGAPDISVMQVGDAAKVMVEAVNNATSYILYWDTSESTITNRIAVSNGHFNTNIFHSTTSFPSIAFGGTNNYYRVIASNKAGKSGYSAYTNIIIKPPVDPPGEFDVRIECNFYPMLFWEREYYAAKYLISVSRGGGPINILTNVLGHITTITDYAAVLGSTNEYFIKSSNKMGISPNTNMRIITPKSNHPDAPAITLNPISTTIMEITWENVSNETGYTLFRSLDNDIDNSKLRKRFEPGVTNFTNMGLIPDTTYYYWIRAYNNYGFACAVSNEYANTYEDLLNLKVHTVVDGEGPRIEISWSHIYSEITNQTPVEYVIRRSAGPIERTNNTELQGLVLAQNDTNNPTAVQRTNYIDYQFEAGETYYYNVGYRDPGNTNNWIFCGPATEFGSIMVPANDIRKFYKMDLKRKTGLTTSQSNPSRWHDMIVDELISVYEVNLAVGSFDKGWVTIVNKDDSGNVLTTPPSGGYNTAAAVLMDGIYSCFDARAPGGASKDKTFIYAASKDADPRIIFDLREHVIVTNVRLYKSDRDKEDDDGLKEACISVANVTRDWHNVGCEIFEYSKKNASYAPPDTSQPISPINMPNYPNWREFSVPPEHQVMKYIRVDLVSMHEQSGGAANLAIIEVEFDMLPLPIDPKKPIPLQSTFNLKLPYTRDRMDVLGYPYSYNSMGIFVLDGDKWRYVGGKVDPGNFVVTADVTELGIFAIFPIDPENLGKDDINIERYFLTVNGDTKNENFRIMFNLKKETEVDVTISDIFGVTVRKLLEKQNINGIFVLTWDGNDVKGNKLKMGPYLFQIKFDGKLERNGSILLVR